MFELPSMPPSPLDTRFLWESGPFLNVGSVLASQDLRLRLIFNPSKG